MKFQVYSRRYLFKKQWYWRLRAENNEVIASGEGYKNLEDCLHSVELVKESFAARVVQDK